MILSEAWQLYKADKQIQGYSSQTLKAYKIQSALFIKHLGNVAIEENTTETIKLYLGEVASDLKVSSLCHRISFIKSLFRWAQEEKYITFNPSTAIKEPKLESKIS